MKPRTSRRGVGVSTGCVCRRSGTKVRRMLAQWLRNSRYRWGVGLLAVACFAFASVGASTHVHLPDDHADEELSCDLCQLLDSSALVQVTLPLFPQSFHAAPTRPLRSAVFSSRLLGPGPRAPPLFP